MAADPLTLGQASRRYFGTPERPPTATPEMADVAERIVRIYVVVRRNMGAPEEVDSTWIQDQVNRFLGFFVNFAERGERIRYESMCALFAPFRPYLNTPDNVSLVGRWVSLFGYTLNGTEIQGPQS
jgi:hypothetical protein